MDRKTKPRMSPQASLIVDLVEAQDEVRKIQREIGRMGSKRQIEYLMKNRQGLLSRIDAMKQELAKKLSNYDAVDIGLFRCAYRVLSAYGRGVSDSILWKFEYESGHQPLDLVNRPEEFFACVGKILGNRSAKQIETAVLFEITNEFDLQISKSVAPVDAIKVARLTLKRVAKETSAKEYPETREKS